MPKTVLFHKGQLVYDPHLPTPALPDIDCAEDSGFRFSISDTEYHCREAQDVPEGLLEIGLRDSFAILPREEYIAAAKGYELLHWDNRTRYCGRCGNKTHRNSPISKICDVCGLEIFPQLSPAVLVLVKKGNSALLVHARNFSRPFFGLVAGFVETGESLEECVAREVMEETSLKVKNIRYIGSQTWPFPANLMIGFTAEYESGNLRFADEELSDGGFFTRDNLPMIPGYPSLARELIDRWVSGEL